MNLQRTSSLSTTSTNTTGSTMFTDARSQFEDAFSNTDNMHNKVKIEDNSLEDKDNVSDESKTGNLRADTRVQMKSSDDTIFGQKNEENINLRSKNNAPIRTEEPSIVEEPKFVSREEKIRQIREQRQTSSTPNEEESDCHAYLFSNNLIDILDLPGWKFWVCGLCTVCCNSLESSGRNTAVKGATGK